MQLVTLAYTNTFISLTDYTVHEKIRNHSICIKDYMRKVEVKQHMQENSQFTYRLNSPHQKWTIQWFICKQLDGKKNID